MTDPPKVVIPARDELRACVRVRPSPLVTVVERPVGSSASREPDLSREAYTFLQHVATTFPNLRTLEHHWKTLGISSGSVKSRVLGELRSAGLIRLHSRGKTRVVSLYEAGWKYLGVKPPTASGTGGPIHQHWARVLAARFKKRGYDVHVEFAVGVNRKRVDLVAFGKKKIGIEIALTSLEQELKNLRDDIQSGVLDEIFVVSPDADLLRRLRSRALADPAIQPHASQIQFYALPEEVFCDG